MNYIVCILLIGLAFSFFLRIVSHIGNASWPLEGVNSPPSLLRELWLRRKSF